MLLFNMGRDSHQDYFEVQVTERLSEERAIGKSAEIKFPFLKTFWQSTVCLNYTRHTFVCDKTSVLEATGGHYCDEQSWQCILK